MSTQTFVDPVSNDEIQKVLGKAEQSFSATTAVSEDAPPPDTHVQLLAGIPSLDMVPVLDAEVRELNGHDEEVLARVRNEGLAVMQVLERAVVSIGGEKPGRVELDSLLAADRILLLIAIRLVTWGEDFDLQSISCPHCSEMVDLSINIRTDIPIREFDGDRSFEVTTKRGKVLHLELPNGKSQREILAETNPTIAELNTILIRNCLVAIDGNPVIDPKKAALNLSSPDRRLILEEISKRNPGPRLEEVSKPCPSCAQEIDLPLTVTALFPLWS